MENAQTLYYRTKDGKWVAIPYSIINVYDAYMQYCLEHNLNAVDRETYYQTLGNLAQYVAEIQRLTGNLTNLEELTNSLENGVLPVTLGGTGQSFGTYDEMLAAFMAHSGVSGHIQTLARGIDTLSNTKADIHYFQSGTKAPDDTTEGYFYFQYKDAAEV